MHVSFGQNCLQLQFKPYLSSESYSVNMRHCQINLSMHIEILQKKIFFQKCVDHIFSFAYLCFNPLR